MNLSPPGTGRQRRGREAVYPGRAPQYPPELWLATYEAAMNDREDCGEKVATFWQHRQFQSSPPTTASNRLNRGFFFKSSRRLCHSNQPEAELRFWPVWGLNRNHDPHVVGSNPTGATPQKASAALARPKRIPHLQKVLTVSSCRYQPSFPDVVAFTIARMPALTGFGSFGQAVTTAASSGGKVTAKTGREALSLLALLPDSGSGILGSNPRSSANLTKGPTVSTAVGPLRYGACREIGAVSRWGGGDDSGASRTRSVSYRFPRRGRDRPTADELSRLPDNRCPSRL